MGCNHVRMTTYPNPCVCFLAKLNCGLTVLSDGLMRLENKGNLMFPRINEVNLSHPAAKDSLDSELASDEVAFCVIILRHQVYPEP